jgi:hypothetical protein
MTSPSDEAGGEECCTTCGQTKTWHEENQPRHAFNGPLGVAPQRPKTTVAPWPFDPVLRQALITKGIITPDDLTAAEDQIRAVTAMVTGQAASDSLYVYADSGKPVYGAVSRHDVFTGKIMTRAEYEERGRR